MQNIELKIKTNNFKQIRQLLEKIKAEFQGNIYQKDTYFNCKEDRLKTREIDRKIFELIYYQRPDLAKSKISNYEIKELDQKEFKKQKNILAKTNGIKTIVIKHRELWIYKNTRIHLDKVKNIGWFIELETVARDSKSLPKLKKEHQKIIDFLDLKQYKVISQSYSDIADSKIKL